MADFNENDLFKVGAITSTHGVHGEVKVFPTTDDIKRFKKQKDYLLKTKDGYRSVTVKSVKYFKQFVILGFEEFSSPEDILPYRRCELYTDREHAIKCEKDEYFIADLIGVAVYDEDEKKVGVIKDVIETGANDVYIIDPGDNRELLVPAIKQCILNVDINNKRMDIHVLPGLFDEPVQEANEEKEA